MGAVVEIWFEYLIPFLLKDSHIVHCEDPFRPIKQGTLSALIVSQSPYLRY